MKPSALERFLHGRVCIVGVGNRDRRDDAVGPLVVGLIAGRTRAAGVVDAGDVPENHLERVVGTAPDAVLIVDAVDLGAEPGAVELLGPEAIRDAGVSTHASSLALCADYIVRRTGASVALLGVQPADVGLGTNLSPAVAEAAVEIGLLLCRLLPRNRQTTA